MTYDLVAAGEGADMWLVEGWDATLETGDARIVTGG